VLGLVVSSGVFGGEVNEGVRGEGVEWEEKVCDDVSLFSTSFSLTSFSFIVSVFLSCLRDRVLFCATSGIRWVRVTSFFTNFEVQRSFSTLFFSTLSSLYGQVFPSPRQLKSIYHLLLKPLSLKRKSASKKNRSSLVVLAPSRKNIRKTERELGELTQTITAQLFPFQHLLPNKPSKLQIVGKIKSQRQHRTVLFVRRP
jgi:hypothetical protein